MKAELLLVSEEACQLCLLCIVLPILYSIKALGATVDVLSRLGT